MVTKKMCKNTVLVKWNIVEIIFPVLLGYNSCNTLCEFKVYKWWFKRCRYCEIINTIQLVNTPIILHRWCVWIQSCLTLATPWTVAHQTALSIEFPRQEYWCGLLFPSPGDLPDPGIKLASLASPALAGWFFTMSVTWEALSSYIVYLISFPKIYIITVIIIY